MVKSARFALYAAVACFVVARNANAIVWGVRALASRYLYLPQAGCLFCGVVLAGAVAAYLVFLSGATLAGWRMPNVVHIPLLGLAAVSLIYTAPSPNLEHATAESVQQETAAVLGDVADQLDKAKGCSLALAERALGHRPSGFRSRGFALDWKAVEVAPGASLEGTANGRPGTVLISCTRAGAYDLAAVVLDHVPSGDPAALHDEVGHVFHVLPPIAPAGTEPMPEDSPEENRPAPPDGGGL